MTTKQKIFKSALKLFAKQGIDKTSTAQITNDVGVASGTLFVHFKTKQELIDTLYLSIKEKAFNNISDYIDPAAPAEKTVKSFAKYMIEYFVNNYDEFIFIELVDNDPQVSQEAMAEGRSYFSDLMMVIEQWTKDQKLKQLDLELLAGTMWSLSVMLVRYCKAAKQKKVPESYLDIIWDAVKH